MAAKTYFVSGHVDLTEEEFAAHYVDKINAALKEKATFLMGDADGADYMAAKYLHEKGCHRVVIYYKGMPTVQNPFGYMTRGPFPTHPAKDAQMTADSDEDIVWLRPYEVMKKMIEDRGEVFEVGRISGTEQNILRRARQTCPKPGEMFVISCNVPFCKCRGRVLGVFSTIESMIGFFRKNPYTHYMRIISSTGTSDADILTRVAAYFEIKAYFTNTAIGNDVPSDTDSEPLGDVRAAIDNARTSINPLGDSNGN